MFVDLCFQQNDLVVIIGYFYIFTLLFSCSNTLLKYIYRPHNDGVFHFVKCILQNVVSNRVSESERIGIVSQESEWHRNLFIQKGAQPYDKMTFTMSIIQYIPKYTKAHKKRKPYFNAGSQHNMFPPLKENTIIAIWRSVHLRLYTIRGGCIFNFKF